MDIMLKNFRCRFDHGKWKYARAENWQSSGERGGLREQIPNASTCCCFFCICKRFPACHNCIQLECISRCKVTACIFGKAQFSRCWCASWLCYSFNERKLICIINIYTYITVICVDVCFAANMSGVCEIRGFVAICWTKRLLGLFQRNQLRVSGIG